MNKPFFLSCNQVMDEIFEFSGEDEVSLVQRLRIGLHLFFCARCAEESRKLVIMQEMLNSDFFPPAPDFEEKVMEQLSVDFQEEAKRTLSPELPGGFSFRSWTIIGFIILVSLAISFFGIDFIEAASNQRSTFLIQLGITVGTMLTGYGAFFIASHLKELSEHFKIH